MRYYELTITNTGGQVFQPSSTGDGFSLGATGSTFSSFVNGRTIPGALNVEFDLPVYPFHTPQGRSIIRVWGIGLKMIGQASDLNGQNFKLAAGMKKGLPLANPAQAGVLAQGQIYQAFGNWEGVNQTLDLICNPGGLVPSNGIVFQWQARATLASAIATSLNQAFPTYEQNIAISDNLKTPNSHTQDGTYPSLDTFSQYINELTQGLGAQFAGSSYPGVQISISGNTFQVYDGTVAPPSAPTQLAFQDLIGQPTWISAATVAFKTVLRSDIAVGDQVKFPQGVIAPYALTSPNAAVPGAPSRSKTVFQGTFVITEVHHISRIFASPMRKVGTRHLQQW